MQPHSWSHKTRSLFPGLALKLVYFQANQAHFARDVDISLIIILMTRK